MFSPRFRKPCRCWQNRLNKEASGFESLCRAEHQKGNSKAHSMNPANVASACFFTFNLWPGRISRAVQSAEIRETERLFKHGEANGRRPPRFHASPAEGETPMAVVPIGARPLPFGACRGLGAACAAVPFSPISAACLRAWACIPGLFGRPTAKSALGDGLSPGFGSACVGGGANVSQEFFHHIPLRLLVAHPLPNRVPAA